MKKLILLLSMLLCVMVSAKTLTDSEKREMLRQFSEFQQAVRNEDAKTLVTMIKFPFEDSIPILPGDDIDPITKQNVLDYSDLVFDFFKVLTFLNVDLSNLTVSEYTQENHSCDLNYSGKFKGNEFWIIGDWSAVYPDRLCKGGYDIKFKMVDNKLKLMELNVRL